MNSKKNPQLLKNVAQHITIDKKSPSFKNFIQRMILLTLGASYIIITFNFSWNKHLIVRLSYTFFMLLIGREVHNNLLPPTLRPQSIIMSMIAAIIYPCYILLQSYFPQLFIIGTLEITPELPIIMVILGYSILSLTKKWRDISKLIGLLFIIIYPGLIGSYWLRLAELEFATAHLYAIIGTIYMNDGFAYFSGIFFGKIEKKRRPTPLLEVSPKKTIVGYIGGFIFGMSVFPIIYYVLPQFFNHNIVLTLIFGVIINLASMLGDLLESALKRIFEVKDTGSIMLGRGGVLDTFDSTIFVSPIYFILYTLLFL